MKKKMAQAISVYLCEHCASIHIGMYRGGELFAEAIPDNPGELLNEMRLALAESQLRQGKPVSSGCH